MPAQDFRTVMPPLHFPFRIAHEQSILLLGSCFTEHIGQYLQDRKFPCLVNPFGIVYNPVSIAQCLERLAARHQFFTAAELFEHEGLWHSWSHHGRFSHPDQAVALEKINAAYAAGAAFLAQTDVLLLTLGTSDVFCLSANGAVVANNHKVPAAQFHSRRLSVTETVDTLAGVIERLQAQRPALRVVLTVSPVRHLRLGLTEHQRSKAVLLLACEALGKQLSEVYYFPAYELLMDDLRDYRFYASDLIHPSEMAVEYIWQYFSGAFFSADTQGLIGRIEKLKAAAAHRPFHADTAQHQTFVRAQRRLLDALKTEAPGLDFSAEEAMF